MSNDLMPPLSLLIVLLSWATTVTFGQQTIVYVKRGDTAELCDNRSTQIYAYEYRSFDGRKNVIVESLKNDRYSNPYQTSLLRISNANENDSGQYKCPQDDTEWQKLQVYVPVQHVHLSNLHAASRVHSNDFCGIENNNNCLAMVEGEPLDVVCAADGHPRPALDISLDKNGTQPTIMALASGVQTPTMVNDQFKPSVYEAYRIVGLTPTDNGRNVTCHVDMKQIDRRLTLSTTKQLYIEFRPTVAEKSKKIYCGINQTRTINCTIIRANPTYMRYSINGLPASVLRRTYGDQHDLHYTFDITPTSIEQFRPFNVTANNSIGFDTCTYELIHGGVPDAITQCSVDTQTSNVTITISCMKSYAQGDQDGYACTLFKYNDKANRKMFEEIARTKSCIFALENFHEPVEFRVAAFNRFGSLPVNTYGYSIQLNQPIVTKETPFFSRRTVLILGGVIGGVLLLIIFCCLCGTCHHDRSPYLSKNDPYPKTQYPRSSTESEELKPITDETITQLVPHSIDKRTHQAGAVYDIPSHLTNGNYAHQTSSTPISSAYHQQKTQRSSLRNYADQDTLNSSALSMPTRIHTVSNKFYGHPSVDSKYGPFSPTSMVVPSVHRHHETDEILEIDDEDDDDSPMYSTTTEAMSESGSFLVPSSTKRYAPPAPKPRYSTLCSVRSPMAHLDRTPLPLPKPRSRSNSRTRLNNLNTDNSSCLYEERPASSSDSGIGLVTSRQNTLQQQYAASPYIRQEAKYSTVVPSIARGTEC